MKNGQVNLPSVVAMAAALQKTTERLAIELAAPSDAPPSWTDFEWDIACAVAAMHGVSPLLLGRLRWRGPASWQRFLEEQQQQSAGRHRQITAVLRTVELKARQRNIGCVALKGAALIVKQLYAVGERPMGDVDLLVRPEAMVPFGDLLKDCAYDTAFQTRRHEVFNPRFVKKPVGVSLGEHVDNPIKIELHSKVAEHLPVSEIDITSLLSPGVFHAGLNAYPSPTALMVHLLLHAAGNMRAHALRLLQLHDMALLATGFCAEDWAEFCEIANDRSLWWAYAPALLVSRYYPDSFPADIVRMLSVGCPLWLTATARKQRLTAVSWSNIRIAAFPGLEWSRTSVEALAFMWGRIWPSHEARSDLRDGAAQIPESSTVPWYSLPHRTRIFRWIFSKPPRVQTLLSIRAALAREP